MLAPCTVVLEYSVVVVPDPMFIFSRLRLFASSAMYLVSFSAALTLEAWPTPVPVRPVPVVPEVVPVVVVPVRLLAP